MRKIPVVRSIGRAYGFGLGHFTTAVAICWVPYLLLAAAAVFVVTGPAHELISQVFAAVSNGLDVASDDNRKDAMERAFKALLPAYGSFYRYAVLLFLLNMLVQAMVAVGLTRASMGLDQGNGFFFLSFEAPVWKLFGAWLATYLIMYAATFVLIFAGIMLGAIAGIGLAHTHAPAFVAFCVFLVLAALTLMAWLAIRLNFFLPAIIVSEKKLDLLRSWNLSEGNVWRIIAIYFSFLPVLIILLIAGSLAKIIAFLAFVPHWLSLPERLSDNANWTTWTGIMADILPWLPALVAVAVLTQILLSAMLYAATARAYRGIVATDIAPQTERE
jgi:hypothetical protein